MGRIACYAKSAGVSNDELVKELERCVSFPDESEECRTAKNKVFVYEATFEIVLLVLTVVFPIIRAVRIALRFVRLSKTVRDNIEKVEKEVDDLITRLRTTDLKDLPIDRNVRVPENVLN